MCLCLLYHSWLCYCLFYFFFFKQKTAYEMRISDWSSDVCSSDLTPQGIARRDGDTWQTLPNKSAGAEQNRLFLAVLQGDSSGLQRDFDLSLSGQPQQWKLTLTPRSVLLKQIFEQINIDGGELVQRIELLETQGDRTVLRMQDSTSAKALSKAEQHDFAE